MTKGTFKYTNGMDTFTKEFQAEDEKQTYAQVRETLKHTGCGLAQGSIRLGTKRLRDIEIVFEPHRSQKERAGATVQNMLRAEYESYFEDWRF